MAKNKEYWNKRFEALENAQMNKGAKYFAELEKQYRKASSAVQRDIEKWYARFANNNEITLQGARKLLNTDELEEFRWSVMEYVKKGETLKYSDQWAKQLENASAKWHISRLEALKLQMQNHVEVLFGNEHDDVAKLMEHIYTDGYYHTAYEIQKGFNVGYSLMELDKNKIEKVISKPWAADGSNFSSRIWKQKNQLVSDLHNNLTQAIIRGQNPKVVTDTIAKRFDVSKMQAGRLVMTESAFFASASNRDCYKDLNVEQYEVLATLDAKTSEICRDLDGKTFKMSEYEVGVTAPPFHCWCYDKETEVYTSSGWKLFSDLGENDLVYTLDEKTLLPEWQKPINYISYRYSGNLLSFRNDRTDIVVTPDHMMLVQNMDSSVKDKSFKLRRADSIGAKSKNRMIGGCNWVGKYEITVILGGREVGIETYLKFMAYWLADGSCTIDRDSYNIKIAQRNNDWMYDEIKHLPFKVYKGKESLIIHDKMLGEELSRYGKCTDKYVPELIKSLTPELIRVFLIAYSKTDGTIEKGKRWKDYQFKDSIVFFSTSDRMASDLGELILKAGGRPSFRLHKMKGREVRFRNGTYSINNDCWNIYWNTQIYSWICYMDVTEMPYDDYVYCVEVKKHNTLLVRRNGKVIWSGNCRSTTVPYFDDEFELGSERAARDEDGKTYYVPSDMKYDDWYDKYVKGEANELNAYEADILNGIKEIVDKFTSHKPISIFDLDGKYSNSIIKTINNSPEGIKQFLYGHRNEINIINERALSRNKFCFEGIEINLKKDFNEQRGRWTGLFHEIGHNVDRITGKPSSKYGFGQCLKTEFDELVKNYQKYYNVKEHDAFEMISENIRDAKYHSISDLFGALSDNKCVGIYCHRIEYWNQKEMISAEAFAHFFEATCRNDAEKLKAIKQVFPKSFNLFERMLGDIL